MTARATLVAAEPFGSHAEAERWREEVDGEAEADDALWVLHRVLHVHRLAAADPYVRELVRDTALAVRVGVGAGEALAHGRWTTAVELPPEAMRAPASRSSAVLRPQERLAAVLGGTTSRWPARSSRCGHAPTSRQAASARPHCSCASRWRARCPSSRRGRIAR